MLGRKRKRRDTKSAKNARSSRRKAAGFLSLRVFRDTFVSLRVIVFLIRYLPVFNAVD